MKKIVLGAVGGLVLLVVAGLWYVYSNLDRLVEQAIETAGSSALGTQVSVEGVQLELAAGRASIRGFAIANPEGFSANELLRFDELSVALDLANLSQQHLGILSVVARNPRLYFESRGRESNIDALQRHLQASAPAAGDATAGAGTPLQVSIASVEIERIRAVLDSDLLTRIVEVELGDIHLEDIEGTPDEVAQQVAVPVLRQLGSNVASAMLSLKAEDLKDAAAELGRSALEKAAAAGESLKEGFNNLLERN